MVNQHQHPSRSEKLMLMPRQQRTLNHIRNATFVLLRWLAVNN